VERLRQLGYETLEKALLAPVRTSAGRVRSCFLPFEHTGEKQTKGLFFDTPLFIFTVCKGERYILFFINGYRLLAHTYVTLRRWGSVSLRRSVDLG
jgi:hypothetical protein